MKTLLAVATVALAATTFAAGPKECPKRGPGKGMMECTPDPIVKLVTNPKMAEKIGLTEEQREKIKEIGKECHAGRDEMKKQLQETMKKQTELLKAEKVDEAAVMAEIDKAFNIRKELAKRQTKRIIRIKAILTPEQVEKALGEIRDRQKEQAAAKAKKKAGKVEAGKDDEEKDGEKCDKKNGDEEKPRKRQKQRKQRETQKDED